MGTMSGRGTRPVCEFFGAMINRWRYLLTKSYSMRIGADRRDGSLTLELGLRQLRIRRYASAGDRLAQDCLSPDVGCPRSLSALSFVFSDKGLAHAVLSLFLGRYHHVVDVSFECQDVHRVCSSLGRSDGLKITGLRVSMQESMRGYENSMYPFALGVVCRSFRRCFCHVWSQSLWKNSRPVAWTPMFPHILCNASSVFHKI